MEIDAQYRAIREGAGLLDRSARRWIGVDGSEAGEFLQGQITNDVEALEPGAGCYAALLDRKGRIRADMRVLRTAPDGFLIDTEPEAAELLLAHLSLYRVGRDADVAALASQPLLLSLLGPRTAQVLDAPVGPEHSHRETRLAGHDCRVIATDLGADLLLAAADGAEVEAHLLDAGAEPIGAEAAEVARVEAGRPRLGREIGPQTMPQEAGINDRAVSFTKGCDVGQETVARLHYKGKPNRHLRRLIAELPMSAGEPVIASGREVGTIGTAVISPARGPVALAILRREAEPGAEVEVAGAGGEQRARVEAIAESEE